MDLKHNISTTIQTSPMGQISSSTEHIFVRYKLPECTAIISATLLTVTCQSLTNCKQSEQSSSLAHLDRDRHQFHRGQV